MPAAQRILAAALLVGMQLPIAAQANTYQASASKNSHKSGTYFQRHPKVKAATIGAGVGTAAGAVTGLVSGKGVVRGAAIGAGTGAGVGLISSSKTLKKHPLIAGLANGGVTGLGLGLAASKGHGSGKTAAKAAGVGAALGLGAGFLKDKIR